jgi:hypothetical protein
MTTTAVHFQVRPIRSRLERSFLERRMVPRRNCLARSRSIGIIHALPSSSNSRD